MKSSTSSGTANGQKPTNWETEMNNKPMSIESFVPGSKIRVRHCTMGIGVTTGVVYGGGSIVVDFPTHPGYRASPGYLVALEPFVDPEWAAQDQEGD